MIGLIDRFSEYFEDNRAAGLIEHDVKPAAKRGDCAPIAGKSTLNRLELSSAISTRYHKITHDPSSIEALFVALFLEAHRKAPAQIILDLDATDDPLYGDQEGRFFHGYYDCYCYLPL